MAFGVDHLDVEGEAFFNGVVAFDHLLNQLVNVVRFQLCEEPDVPEVDAQQRHAARHHAFGGPQYGAVATEDDHEFERPGIAEDTLLDRHIADSFAQFGDPIAEAHAGDAGTDSALDELLRYVDGFWTRRVQQNSHSSGLLRLRTVRHVPKPTQAGCRPVPRLPSAPRESRRSAPGCRPDRPTGCRHATGDPAESGGVFDHRIDGLPAVRW